MEAGLTGLLQALRAAGFRAGPAEAIAAARLVKQLQQHPESPADAASLRLWLRPVLCSNREEQARFDALFAEWAQMMEQRRLQRDRAGDQEVVSPPLEAEPSPWQRWTARMRAAAPGLAVLALVVAVAVNLWQRREDPSDAAPKTSEQVAKVSSNGTPAEPKPPPITAKAPPQAKPLGPGFAPAWREARTLRPEIVLPLLLAPLLLAWLLGGAPPLALLRGQRRSPRSVALDTRRLESQARALLPSLEPGVAGRLERHLRADSAAGAPLARRRRIDERRTVEALLRRPGDLRLRHRPAPLRPSYLVLVDTQDENDPRGRLFVHWADRLRREGLEVQVRTFRHAGDADAAPLSQALRGRSGDTALPLDVLPDPPAGQRLVVVGETMAWAHPDGNWRAWYRRARLHRWRERAFFTPTELRDWGDREGAIEQSEHAADPGFLMLPMDDSALAAWSVLLASGWLPPFSLSEPQRYPRLLAREDFDPFAAPEPDERERLVAQLMLYLGDTGFRWLCMLAVPPLVRWELTLLLGQSLQGDAGGASAAEKRFVLGRAYRRLTRLPWLRGQPSAGGVQAPGIPNWLRLRLLDELPPAAAEDVRHRVDALLSTLHEGPGTLELGFEAPPPHGPSDHAAPPDAPGDALYLGLLTGMTPRQLAQRVPDPWRAWLRPREPARGVTWRARWRQRATGASEWLRARRALIAFRDGLPWAERNPAVWVLAVVVTAATGGALWRITGMAQSQIARPLEAALFSHRTLPVEVPLARGAKAGVLAPDGSTAALLGVNGRIHIADAASGRVLRSFGDAAFADHLLFDGDRVVACASGDAPDDVARRASAWSATGKPQADTPLTDCPVLPSNTRRDPLGMLLRAEADLSPQSGLQTSTGSSVVVAAAYDRDGALVATADFDGAITLSRLIKADGSTKVEYADRRLDVGWSTVQTLSLSDDGSSLLSVQEDGSVRVSHAWQPPLGQTVEPAVAAAVSADGRKVVSASSDGQLRLHVRSGEGADAVTTLSGPVDVRALALNTNGSEVAALDGDGVVWAGSVAVGPVSPLTPTLVLAMAYTADGRLRLADAEGGIFDHQGNQTDRIDTLRHEGAGVVAASVHRSGLVVTQSSSQGAPDSRPSSGLLGALKKVTQTLAPPQTVAWRTNAGVQGNSGAAQIESGSVVIGSEGQSLWWTTSAGEAVGLRIAANEQPAAAWAEGGPFRIAAFDDQRKRFARIDPEGRLQFIDLGGNQPDVSSSSVTGVASVQALPQRRWLVVHDDGVVRIADDQGGTWPALILSGAPGTVQVAAQGRVVMATSVARPATAPAASPDTSQKQPEPPVSGEVGKRAAAIAPKQEKSPPVTDARKGNKAPVLRKGEALLPARPVDQTQTSSPQAVLPLQVQDKPIAGQTIPGRASWWALPSAPLTTPVTARATAWLPATWAALMLVVAGAAVVAQTQARRWRVRKVKALLGGATAGNASAGAA